ncbi:MAG: hypothetical protein HN337_00370, partial [Deltaproteobacteria bacterium]|nr:hypothetical protein [Deltaproteobacteria bacterium]
MSQSFENGLRRAMYLIGKTLENLIGKAKEAKVQVSSRSGMQPVMSMESLLDYNRIKDLIESSIQKVMETQIPDLK